MLINDILILRDSLIEAKVGKLSSDTLRKYLKFLNTANKYFKEFEDKRGEYVADAIKTLGYDSDKLNNTKREEVFNLITPILNEFLFQDVDVNSHIFTWEELNDAILSYEGNEEMPIDKKTYIAGLMCSEEL